MTLWPMASRAVPRPRPGVAAGGAEGVQGAPEVRDRELVRHAPAAEQARAPSARRGHRARRGARHAVAAAAAAAAAAGIIRLGRTPGKGKKERRVRLGRTPCRPGPRRSASSRPRVRPDYHFRRTATEYDRKPGMKRLSCAAERHSDMAPSGPGRRRPPRGSRGWPARVYEGALSFAIHICCTYRNSTYKREWGGIMAKGPRLSRPRGAPSARGPRAPR
jgi:hypothetical protein